jgi:nucleotide-binding universal stress UspA family protein
VAFFCGRLVSYSLYVGAASAASESLGTIVRDSLTSPIGIALQLLMLAALTLLLRVDWSRRPAGGTATGHRRPGSGVATEANPQSLPMTPRTRAPSLGRKRHSRRFHMPRKIIIGYEPTSQGLDALELGEALAETLAARPVIVTVLPWPEYLMNEDDLEHALAVDTAEIFAVARDRLAALEPETRAIANTSPAEGIYDLADREHALLIVVGSTHRGALGRVLPGSVGVSLLQGAPCAVAVAPRDYTAREEHRLQHVAVAFDGSPEAWPALETGICLAEHLHASFTALAVAEPTRYGYAASLSALTAREYGTYEQEAKRRALDAAVARAPANLAVEARLMNGDPGKLLTEASGKFDLLLIGSRGYGPLRRTLLGSVAAKVMHRAECPVLVLPRAAGMDPMQMRAGIATPHRVAG